MQQTVHAEILIILYSKYLLSVISIRILSIILSQTKILKNAQLKLTLQISVKDKLCTKLIYLETFNINYIEMSNAFCHYAVILKGFHVSEE